MPTVSSWNPRRPSIDRGVPEHLRDCKTTIGRMNDNAMERFLAAYQMTKKTKTPS